MSRILVPPIVNHNYKKKVVPRCPRCRPNTKYTTTQITWTTQANVDFLVIFSRASQKRQAPTKSMPFTQVFVPFPSCVVQCFFWACGQETNDDSRMFRPEFLKWHPTEKREIIQVVFHDMQQYHPGSGKKSWKILCFHLLLCKFAS